MAATAAAELIIAISCIRKDGRDHGDFRLMHDFLPRDLVKILAHLDCSSIGIGGVRARGCWGAECWSFDEGEEQVAGELIRCLHFQVGIEK
jgi:hypothetical protein